jgi:hypothetical protein
MVLSFRIKGQRAFELLEEGGSAVESSNRCDPEVKTIKSREPGFSPLARR